MGFIAETPGANIAILTKDKEFISIPFYSILKGTTLSRVL